MNRYILQFLGCFLCLLVLSGCQTGSPMEMFQVMPSDSTITNNVQQSLYLSDDPLIANVRAESINGVVFLTGYVKKIRQSDKAEAIAKQVRGVKTVRNNIIVRR